MEVVDYICGADRNNPDTVRSHSYARDAAGDCWPMCGYGWNRSDGERLSILRGVSSARGHCKICLKREMASLPPIRDGWPHKTKWL